MRVDPVVFALGGWSVGVDVAPEGARVQASLAAFHVEVPALLVPLVAAPASGLRVLEDAVQLGARAQLDELAGAWLGPEVYVYRLTYRRAGERAIAHEAYAHVSAGWRVFPLEDVAVLERLFIEPWVTLGVPIFHSGGASVAGVNVSDRGFNWHATVSLGARLGS